MSGFWTGDECQARMQNPETPLKRQIWGSDDKRRQAQPHTGCGRPELLGVLSMVRRQAHQVDWTASNTRYTVHAIRVCDRSSQRQQSSIRTGLCVCSVASPKYRAQRRSRVGRRGIGARPKVGDYFGQITCLRVPAVAARVAFQCIDIGHETRYSAISSTYIDDKRPRHRCDKMGIEHIEITSLQESTSGTGAAGAGIDHRLISDAIKKHTLQVFVVKTKAKLLLTSG